MCCTWIQNNRMSMNTKYNITKNSWWSFADPSNQTLPIPKIFVGLTVSISWMDSNNVISNSTLISFEKTIHLSQEKGAELRNILDSNNKIKRRSTEKLIFKMTEPTCQNNILHFDWFLINKKTKHMFINGSFQCSQ